MNGRWRACADRVERALRMPPTRTAARSASHKRELRRPPTVSPTASPWCTDFTAALTATDLTMTAVTRTLPATAGGSDKPRPRKHMVPTARQRQPCFRHADWSIPIRGWAPARETPHRPGHNGPSSGRLRLSARRERGHGRLRVIPGPVEPPVHRTLHPVPQRA